MYIEYTDPDTGDKYYSDGDFYFSSVYNPAGTTLNWETQGDIIERLRTTQDQTYSGLEYNVFVDPVTNAEYFVGTIWNSGYLFDAHDPDRKKLDPNNPAEKAIIDRLQNQNKTIRVLMYWDNYLDENGRRFYSRDNGQTFIDNAIVSKDKIRAHLGALQNRLENTVTNLSMQAENLQAAESRISDTDVVSEMTLFVRNQVLTQSAVAMLSEANSFPHMLMSLLQG